ncbi:MAG: S9 family peptidase [Calditrichaeota bacterium]|nr:S9 family peptidase [Calditrichota bacterium]
MRRLLKAGLLILVPILAFAQTQKRPMTFQDIFRFKRVSSPVQSPDGKWIVFQASESDWKQNKRISHIYRVEISTKKTTQLTFSREGEWAAKFSPDGRWISFLSSRNRSTQIFLMPANGGEAWQLTHHSTGIRQYAWAVNGKTLYFLAADSLSKNEKAQKAARGNAYYVDHNVKPVHLWSIDLASKKESPCIDGHFSIRSFALSPDNSQIAFIAAPSALRDDDIHNEIYRFTFRQNKIEQLTRNGAIERSVYWTPDGKNLVFISDSNEKLETYYEESIFYLPLKTLKPVDLLPKFPYQVFQLFWDGKKQSTLYFSANTGTDVQLFQLDLKNRHWKKRTSHRGVLSNLNYNRKTSHLAFVFSDPSHPGEVFFSNLHKWNPIQLSRINTLQDSLLLPEYQTIHWKSTDGWTVEGLLIKPIHFKKGRSYPLITQIHGGPESSVKNAFSTSWGYYPAIWAAHGYLVFQPNYRGSTGYGDACMRAIIGHYFEKDWDDIMTGVDYLVKQGLAHPDSLGIMGWSAGGHETNWTITHTNRFKAASSGAGGANWFSFYAQTDMHYIREIWFNSSPYDNTELWLKKSPVMYVKRAQTPTLIFCGEKDKRVPFPQSLEMYRGLKRNGCPVEMVAFPGSGHGPHELKQQLYKMKKEFAWFESHIRNRVIPVD